MKRLVLMRHAKAEHWNPDGDHERELAPRGRTDAANAGLVLADAGLTHAIVSTAARTQQTYLCLGLDLQRTDAGWLYGCGPRTLLEHIAQTDESVTGLLVVGHAPTIPGLSAALADLAGSTDADEVAGWFPTAAFTEFTFEGTWAQLGTQDDLRFVRVHR